MLDARDITPPPLTATFRLECAQPKCSATSRMHLTESSRMVAVPLAGEPREGSPVLFGYAFEPDLPEGWQRFVVQPVPGLAKWKYFCRKHAAGALERALKDQEAEAARIAAEPVALKTRFAQGLEAVAGKALALRKRLVK